MSFPFLFPNLSAGLFHLAPNKPLNLQRKLSLCELNLFFIVKKMSNEMNFYCLHYNTQTHSCLI